MLLPAAVAAAASVGQGGTSALFLESVPGLEDWHEIAGGYGGFPAASAGATPAGAALAGGAAVPANKHFCGGCCAHWTTENTTGRARVSLDFRLVPGPLFRRVSVEGGRAEGGQLDVYRQRPGYYSRARRVKATRKTRMMKTETTTETTTGNTRTTRTRTTRRVEREGRSVLGRRQGGGRAGAEAEAEAEAEEEAWERDGPLLPPDARVGFPFTVKRWDKFLRQQQRAKKKSAEPQPTLKKGASGF